MPGVQEKVKQTYTKWQLKNAELLKYVSAFTGHQGLTNQLKLRIDTNIMTQTQCTPLIVP